MNLNAETQFKKIFDKYFKYQHPESALRYMPIVRLLRRKNLSDSRILEVGSGSLGITPYLKREVDGLDVDFSGPQTSLLVQLKGTALDLPFRKNSYDVVISCDTLEHLKRSDREKAISETMRVAKKIVFIVVPTGKLSQRQDMELDHYYLKVFGKRDKFLWEHVGNGLPQNDEILVSIHKLARKLDKSVKVKSLPLLNLFVRSILMKTWMSKNKYIYYTYMKGFLLLLPLLRYANFGNCYRRMFVIEFEPSNRAF